MKEFINKLPKVELHLHIEGTIEPELMFRLAAKNNIEIPFNSVDEIRAAYQFEDLQSFLNIYYQGANVLQNEQDFFDLTWEYLLRCQQDNVLHTEIFFDPQAHTERGLSFDVVINGIYSALKLGEEKLGISSQLIMSFLRHLSEESAFETLHHAMLHKDKIIAVGLDSAEQGNPPEKFQHVFSAATSAGFIAVAHAGEEGPASNISKSLTLLNCARIDHGVRCVEDPLLLQQLINDKIPLTVCPLSNVKLNVFNEMKDHNIVTLLRAGVCVTINSDDPAYFGGYMNDNFIAVYQAHAMSKSEIAQFTLNAIEASFISAEKKKHLTNITKNYVNNYED